MGQDGGLCHFFSLGRLRHQRPASLQQLGAAGTDKPANADDLAAADGEAKRSCRREQPEVLHREHNLVARSVGARIHVVNLPADHHLNQFVFAESVAGNRPDGTPVAQD
jgi:hypothetical protein